MNRFVCALDGSMVNLSDVVLIRPFDKEADGERWDKLCFNHDVQWIKTREVKVLLLRHEPGDEQFSARWTFFVHEDEVNELHRGIVEPGRTFQLIAPDGVRTRLISEWKPDPTTGRLVEVRWEEPA